MFQIACLILGIAAIGFIFWVNDLWSPNDRGDSTL
jgi:hypothetical protein